MDIPELRTERLRLRAWRESDAEPFAALNADPEVMRFFPSVLDRAASDAVMARITEHGERHGFTFWALEREGTFIGFTGLVRPAFQAHFTPCVEVGWRLARTAWGHGYASEAARAALRFGFERLGLQEIVAFTVPTNVPSRRVMERVHMQHDPEGDFEHPGLPEGHPLRRHVLYRLARARWEGLETGKSSPEQKPSR